MLSSIEDKHGQKRHAAKWNKTNLLRQKLREKIRKKTKDSGASTQWLDLHQSVPSQYKRSELMVKGFRGCGLVVGEKESIFGFQLRLLLEIYFVGMVSYPKVVVDGWDHLMHAIEVGEEVAKSLSI